LAVRTVRAHAMSARARFVRVASNARGIHLEDTPAHNLVHGIAIAGEAAVVDVNGVMSNVVTGDKNKVSTSIDVGDDNVARFKLLRDVADAECGGIAKGPAPWASPRYASAELCDDRLFQVVVFVIAAINTQPRVERAGICAVAVDENAVPCERGRNAAHEATNLAHCSGFNHIFAPTRVTLLEQWRGWSRELAMLQTANVRAACGDGQGSGTNRQQERDSNNQ
jgi:hypothetical protein